MTEIERTEENCHNRKMGLIWEITQAAVAVIVTGAMVYCAVAKIVSAELANAFFLIIGAYFSRNNHAPKTNPE